MGVSMCSVHGVYVCMCMVCTSDKPRVASHSTPHFVSLIFPVVGGVDVDADRVHGQRSLLPRLLSAGMQGKHDVILF